MTTIGRTACVALLLFAAAGVEATDTLQSEDELISVLQSDAALHAKARACQQLGIVGNTRSVPVLAALLSDEKLSDYARSGLEPIGDPTVDDVLREAMGKLDGRLLAGVVNSIGLRRDAKAVAGLQALVDEPAKGVTAEALMALGMIATPQAIDTIRDVLASDAATSRTTAADAALTGAERLANSHRRKQAAALYDAVRNADLPVHLRTAATYGAILTGGDAGVRLLVKELGSEDPDMAAVALWAARDMPSPQVSSMLTSELREAPPALQVRLVQILAERGHAGAREAVEALVLSDQREVRLASIEALGAIGDASSVPTLVRALATGGGSRAMAVASLQALAGDGVDAVLLDKLQQAAGPARIALIDVLASRHCRQALPTLLGDTASTDAAIAKAAFEALSVLAVPADAPAVLRSLLSLRNPSIAPVAENTVAKVCRNRVDAVLTALNSMPSPSGRASLIRVLGRLGGDKACQAVVAAAGDTNVEVKDAAVRALAAWPDPHATGALLEIVKGTRDETHRVLALRGYTRLLGTRVSDDPENVAAQLAEAMALARTSDTRKSILGQLANVPHRTALDLAMASAADADIREEAEVAAVAIARATMAHDREAASAAMRKLIDSSTAKSITDQARAIIAAIDRLTDCITTWLVTGPYTQEGKRYSDLFDIPFEPEKASPEDVGWRSLAGGTDLSRPWIVDLLRTMPGEQRVAYARTWVYSEATQPARLEVGSDDGVKAWLNGTLVHANNAARAAEAYSDSADITLDPGWNALLLKITQNNGPWGFCARVCGRDGKPLDTIRIDPSHGTR